MRPRLVRHLLLGLLRARGCLVGIIDLADGLRLIPVVLDRALMRLGMLRRDLHD